MSTFIIEMFVPIVANQPLTKVDHSITKQVNRKLNPTEPNPFRCKNVMRNPKPISIMTCISWYTVNINKLTLRDIFQIKIVHVLTDVRTWIKIFQIMRFFMSDSCCIQISRTSCWTVVNKKSKQNHEQNLR